MKKEDLQVGLFFYVNEQLYFSGCSLNDAENYGDFLVYDQGHYDVWERLKHLNKNHTVPYDYYPRGRIVYRKTDDTFIIYYDRCMADSLEEISLFNNYDGFNVRYELDEHYCCHKCNQNYAM